MTLDMRSALAALMMLTCAFKAQLTLESSASEAIYCLLCFKNGTSLQLLYAWFVGC
jgi:hypothetical protein